MLKKLNIHGYSYLDKNTQVSITLMPICNRQIVHTASILALWNQLLITRLHECNLLPQRLLGFLFLPHLTRLAAMVAMFCICEGQVSNYIYYFSLFFFFFY